MYKIDKKFLLIGIIVTILFLAASFYYYKKTVQDGDSISWVDFRVYYYAGFGLETKGNIYNFNDGYFIFKYSPIFALILSVIKFSNATPTQALCVWYIILYVSLILSLYLLKNILFETTDHLKIRFFDIVPLLFLFRYLIIINFTKSYLPSCWPFFVRLCDNVLIYLLTPIYLCSLFIIRKNKDNHENLFVMLIVILSIARFIVHNIDRGQANILILVLLLFFAYYLYTEKNTISGIYLGIAITFKIIPIIFLIYLLMEKKYKTFFSSLITFAILIFTPSFKLGFTYNMELLKNWIKALTATIPLEYLQYKNQSLMAMMSRFLSKDSDVALLKLDNASLSVIIFLLYLVIIVLALTCIKKCDRNNIEGRFKFVSDLSIFFILMALLSPVGTKTTFVYLMLPLGLLVNEAFERKFKDKFINSSVLLYLFITYINTTDLIGDFSILVHKYSIMTFSLLVLFVAVLYTKAKKLYL